MRKSPFFILPMALALAFASHAHGAGAGAPPAPGPSPDLANEAAQTAVQACARMGFKTTATVVNTAGDTVAVQSADPQSDNQTQKVWSASKATAAAEYNTTSADVAERAKGDAIIAPAVRDDPKIKVAAPGGVPLSTPDAPKGGIGVAGTPDGFKDEACARAGASKVASRLK